MDTTLEYTYDRNGNVTKDLNKGITEIKYNMLNLPSKITYSDGSTAAYTYSAAGDKLGVRYVTANSNVYEAYCGNFIYRAGSLKRVLVDGGYITLSGSTPHYHFYLRDHLGNNRAVVNASKTVEEVSHYYPYGGLFGENAGSSVQPYKYNGKELDRMNGLDWYDYGARHMDGALGRFTTMDPLCEKYYAISPYAYCANNPIIFVDPNGCFIGDYYNLSGNYIGTDGIHDNTNYFVLNPEEQKIVKKNNKNNTTTDRSTLSSVVHVPSNTVVERMEEAFNLSENNGNEHGFLVGIKGTVTSIVEGSPDEINIWDNTINELRESGDHVAYDVHTHHKGDGEYYGKAEPSPTDIQNVITSSRQPSVVLGYTEARPFPNPNMIGGQIPNQLERKIGFYNSNGIIYKPINFSQFKRAVKKVNMTK